MSGLCSPLPFDLVGPRLIFSFLNPLYPWHRWFAITCYRAARVSTRFSRAPMRKPGLYLNVEFQSDSLTVVTSSTALDALTDRVSQPHTWPPVALSQRKAVGAPLQKIPASRPAE